MDVAGSTENERPTPALQQIPSPVVSQREKANHQGTKFAKGHQVNAVFCSALPSVVLVKLCALCVPQEDFFRGILVVKHLSMLFNMTTY
jgi:hypothetical protein